MPRTIDLLNQRADLNSAIRDYFKKTGVLEVSTPVLSFSGNTDPAIDSFQTIQQKTMYLHTSPEFFMKRLLVEGSGSIYQICPVFRAEESGRQHNPEFTMLEWYRVGYDYKQLMDDVAALINEVSGREFVIKKLSYQQAFSGYGIDPHSADISTLKQLAGDNGIDLHSPQALSRDNWLELIMSQLIEPQFAEDCLTFIYDYPASQASLAKVRQGEIAVAERFELYWGCLELANGFTELLDADEQLSRFEAENEKRRVNAQSLVPVDQHFIAALRAGMPACSGVALGIDRLLMCLTGAAQIKEVMPFPIQQV